MPRSWSGRRWEIEIEGNSVSIKGHGSSFTLFGDDAATVTLARSWFRWFLYIDGRRTTRLYGMRRAAVDQLRLELRKVTLADDIAQAVTWREEVEATTSTARQEQRWVSRERVDQLVGMQPRSDLREVVRAAEIEPLLSSEELRAIAEARLDVRKAFDDLNEHTLRSELRDRREFFEKIEKSPLTEEQALT
jgi:DNA helicase-4